MITSTASRFKVGLAVVVFVLLSSGVAQIMRAPAAEAAGLTPSATCGLEQDMIVVQPSYKALKYRAWLFEWNGTTWGDPIAYIETGNPHTWYGLKDRTYYQVRVMELTGFNFTWSQAWVLHKTYDYLATNTLIGRLLRSSNYSWCYT